MSIIAALAAATWLGIVTSISPCPLATNIAAVSFLGRRLESRRLAAWAVLSYALGRAVTYVIIGLATALPVGALALLLVCWASAPRRKFCAACSTGRDESRSSRPG